MTSIAAQLKLAREELAPISGELAALEARLLAQAAWGITQEALVSDADQRISEDKTIVFDALIKRRLQREPIAQIVGHKHFWKDSFIVSRDVLTPRADSETVIETVLMLRPDISAPVRILDLGTGSGCLLLSLLREYPHARGMGVDISDAALAMAAANAEGLSLTSRVGFLRSDWCIKLDKTSVFDVIITNPPYIPREQIDTLDMDVRAHEPHLALNGGNDGLDCYRAILAQLGPHLAKKAVIVCEIGFGQARMVENIAQASGYAIVDVAKDLSDIERVVAIERC